MGEQFAALTKPPLRTATSGNAPAQGVERSAAPAGRRAIPGRELDATPGNLHHLQRTIGNRAVQRLAQSGLLQRDPGDDADTATVAGPPTLDQVYRAALASARATGDWQDAAEKLNGFSHADIQTRLAELTTEEVGRMHAGALDNPRVGPDSNVAKLTLPEAPRASTNEPESSQAPAPAPSTTPDATPAPQGKCPKPVPDMTNFEKLSCAIDFARESRDGKMDEQLKALQSKQSIFAMVTFAALFVGAQVTPVGWVADAFALAGLTLAAVFTGAMVFQVASDLGTFVGAINATSEAELKVAGEALSEAVATGGVALVTALITHAAGEIPPGKSPFTAPPMEGFQDAVTTDGQLVRIPMEQGTGPENLQSTGSGPGEKAPAQPGAAPAEKTIPAEVEVQPGGEFTVEEAQSETGTHIWSRQTTGGKVLIMGDVEVAGETVKVNGVHTQLETVEGRDLKGTQNTVGPKQVLAIEADFARFLGKQFGSSRVEIYPATRTTPGFEGKLPRPRIYNLK